MIEILTISKDKINENLEGRLIVFTDRLRYEQADIVDTRELIDPIEVTRYTNSFEFGIAQKMITTGQEIVRLRQYETSSYLYAIVSKNWLGKIEVPTYLEMITPVLEKYMPGRWWYEQNTEKLHLYYPEIQITNSVGIKHTIYDLVVHIRLSSRTMISELYGTRFSFTMDEIRKDYAHSHLPGICTEGTFCLGPGSVVSNLLLTLPKKFNAASFEFFLFQLQSYLEWESIEGRPHRDLLKLGTTQAVMDPAASINFRQIDLLAIWLLNELTPDMLLEVNGIHTFDPGFARQKFMEIEHAVIQRAISSQGGHFINNLIFDYDPNLNTFYQTTQSSDVGNLPIHASSGHRLVRQFNINCRIIPSKQTTQSHFIKRLAPNIMDLVVKRINLYLIHQIHLDATISGTTESTDNNNQQVSQQG